MPVVRQLSDDVLGITYSRCHKIETTHYAHSELELYETSGTCPISDERNIYAITYGFSRLNFSYCTDSY